MSANKHFFSASHYAQSFFKKISGAQLSLSDAPGQHELKIQTGHPEAATGQGRGYSKGEHEQVESNTQLQPSGILLSANKQKTNQTNQPEPRYL